MCILPLCTPIVCPTISGIIVDDRLHVFTTRFSRVSFKCETFLMRESATNGPFFNDLAIGYAFRFRTIIFVVRLLRRVFLPIVICPHGVVGGRPDVERASPPPCGWSTGFIAIPRTLGRLPRCR